MLSHSGSRLLSRKSESSLPVSIPTLSSYCGGVVKRYDGKMMYAVPYDYNTEEGDGSIASNDNYEWNDDREELLLQLQEIANLNGTNVSVESTIRAYKIHVWIFSFLL